MAYITGSGLVCSDGTSQTVFPLGINDVGQYRLCIYPPTTNGTPLVYGMNTGIAGSSLLYDVRTAATPQLFPSAVYGTGNPAAFPGGYSYSVINFGSWRSMHAFRIDSTLVSSTWQNVWPLVLFQRYA